MNLITNFSRLLVLIISLSSLAFAANDNQATVIKRYPMRIYVNAIKNLYATVPASQSNNINVRVAADSAYFLGKPYVLGSLGESPMGKFDKDPLFRTDEFDCVTYASMVLALAESQNYLDFTHRIIKVRYQDALPIYVHRNHFVSVDWNPNNEKNGYLKDITKQLFPKTYKTAVTVINKPSWYEHLKANNLKLFIKPTVAQTQQLLEALHAQGKQTEVTVSRLVYVPLSALYNKAGKANMFFFNRIPTGTIIEIVRPDWNIKKEIGTNMNISHMGFGIRKGGVLMYRDASSIEHKVVDIPLTKYLATYLNSPTVKGIHIEKIEANFDGMIHHPPV